MGHKRKMEVDLVKDLNLCMSYAFVPFVDSDYCFIIFLFFGRLEDLFI